MSQTSKKSRPARIKGAFRPAKAWTASGVIVALCLLASILALWVFGVISLPWAGRFRPLLPHGPSRPHAPLSPPRQEVWGNAFQRSLAVEGSWPARSGGHPANQKALGGAVSAFLASTRPPAREGYIIANGDGRVLSASNADRLFEPASTTKTLTSLAAVSTLDMGSTLHTDIRLLPRPAGDRRTIVLHGGGDMLLGSGRSDPAHVNGRAGLATLAQKTAGALAGRHVRSVLLKADESFFGRPQRPATMGEYYVKTGFFTPTSSLAVDEGRQNTPPSDPDSIDRDTVPRVDDPGAAAVNVFAGKLVADLSARGIRLANPKRGTSYTVPTLSERALSARFTLLARVNSAPLSQILRLTLRLSDNTLAEEFGRLTALKLRVGNSPAAAAVAVEKQVRAQGVSLGGARLSDCSGLSPGTRLTPRILLSVMERLSTHADATVLRGLPVVTRANYGYPAEAYGRVRLKSGSLDTVVSDSGLVLRTNGAFFYYVALINVPEGQWAARSNGLSAMLTLAGKLVTL